MKAYVITTGTAFGLLVVAHIWRVVEEGPRLARDPFFVVITATAGALAIWAWRVIKVAPR